MMKKAFGYVRISTCKQDLENQRQAIKKAVYDMDETKLIETYEETISSRKEKREIFKIVENLKESDILIVYELSRLGRSIGEIHKIVETVKEKKANIFIIVNNLKLGYGLSKNEELTSSAMIFALGLGAQIERDLISERTKNALKARKEQGVKLGRPAGLGKKVEQAISEKGMKEQDIKKLIEKGVLNASSLGRLLDVDKRTAGNYIKAKGLKKGKGEKWT